MLRELIKFFVLKLVNDPQKVSISEFESEGNNIIEIRVAPQDIEKLIGREGRTFKALRNMVNALEPDIKREIVIDIAV